MFLTLRLWRYTWYRAMITPSKIVSERHSRLCPDLIPQTSTVPISCGEGLFTEIHTIDAYQT